jgi:zinc transport system substrate-binding protein
MNIKKIILIILLIAIIVVLEIAVFNVGNNKTNNSDKIQVVASTFASYDFLRAIIGETDNIELTYLLGAGKDTHSYDPTAGDLIIIQNADLFVYVGGEMEKWADKVLDSLEKESQKVICIADDIETIEEQEVDGAEKDSDDEEQEGAFDEHIWTSPANAIIMINSLEQALEELDSANAEIYKSNAENYIAQIREVDSQIQEIVDNKLRDRLIFADKMPMQYFINYYNLKVSAAFSGCSTETEPSASTISYLEKKVKEEKIPVILYIELNTGKVAQVIADETGAEALQIQTLHNVSKNDFDNGETWVSLMTRNIDVLRKALQ